MPSSHLYQPTDDGCLEMLSNEQFSALLNVPISNFNIDMNDWDYFLAWDGRSPAGIEDRKGIVESIQPMNIQPMGIQSMNMQPINMQPMHLPQERPGAMSRQPTDESFDSMLVEDAPFDVDELNAFPFNMDRNSISHPLSMTEEPIRSYRAYSSLSLAEEQQLQDIAMPYRTLAGNAASPMAIVSSPEETMSPQDEKVKRKPRTNKRKSTEMGQPDSEGLCQSRKRGHNAIEKRYRTNLNDKIMALRESIPSIFTSLDGEPIDEDGEEHEEASDASMKYGKAAILTRAVEYITHLEESTRRMGMEAVVLKARVLAFEKLAAAGSIVMADPSLCQRTLIAETLETIQAEFKALKPAKVAKTSSVKGKQPKAPTKKEAVLK